MTEEKNIVEYNPETMRFTTTTSNVTMPKVSKVRRAPSVKTCLYCGKEFIGKRKNQRFCNQSCAMKAQRANPDSIYNSEKCLKKISDSLKAIWANPNSVFNSKEYQLEHSKIMKANLAIKEYQVKISEGLKVSWKNPESKFNSEERSAKIRESRLHQRLPNKGTLIEKTIENMLREIGIAYIPAFPLGRYQYDFALPEYGILIECDGEYWHSNFEAIKNDKEKDIIAKDCKYILLRFTGTEIKKNLDHCREVILSQIQGIELGQWQPKAVEYNPKTMKFSISNN